MSADDISKPTAEDRRPVTSDADNRPWTDEELAGAKSWRPHPKVLRLRLRMSQEEFAETFRIPIGTLRDWEQGRKYPDAATRAYLTVINHAPDAVRQALAVKPPSPDDTESLQNP